MNNPDRCAGKVTNWTAYLTVFLSAVFIFIIVNRNSLSPSEALDTTTTAFIPETIPVEASTVANEALIDIPAPNFDVTLKVVRLSTSSNNTRQLDILDTTAKKRSLSMPNIKIDVAQASVELLAESALKTNLVFTYDGESKQALPFQLSLKQSSYIATESFKQKLLLSQATSILPVINPPQTLRGTGSASKMDTAPSLVVLERHHQLRLHNHKPSF